jgi:predicted DNA-binding protein
MKSEVIYVRCDAAMQAKLREFATRTGVPVAAFVRQAVEDALKRYEEHKQGDSFPRSDDNV